MFSKNSYLYRIVVNKEKLFGAKCVLGVLHILSIIYEILTGLRLLFYKFNIYRRYSFNKPVISVGNIDVGGSGKTAFVQTLYKVLKDKFGISSAILLRGYGAKIQISDYNYRLQITENTVKKNMVDEEAMLHQNLKDTPILVGKDRIANAKFAFEKLDVDCVILDDGYQYLKLNRDLNIVLLKVTSILGKRFVLPRGLLRESYSRLNRADIIILTDVDRILLQDLEIIKDFIKTIVPSVTVLSAIYQPLVIKNLITGKEEDFKYYQNSEEFLGVSGIGDPDSFIYSLSKTNLKLGGYVNYPDHYDYCQGDINHIIRVANGKNIYNIITTQKDACKLKLYIDSFINGKIKNVLILKVKLKLRKESEEKLHDRLFNLFNN